MKTLAYFASGTHIDFERLKSIQFDQIILVNHHLSNRRIKKLNSRILLLSMDAFEAVDYLQNENIKLDAFISLNEGLCEGGGDYPLNGFYFLSYLTPILKDTYYHIYDPSYYRFDRYFTLATKKAFKDHWFTESDKMKLTDIGIPIDSFDNLEKAICIKMNKKQSDEFKSKEFSNLTYVKGNIWEHFSELDLLLLPYNLMHSYFIDSRNKLIWFEDNIFPTDELEMFVLPQDATIGLTLWYGQDYATDFKKLNKWALDNNVQIKVFFVHENDKNKLI